MSMDLRAQRAFIGAILYGPGYQLAQRELPALEAQLATASPADREALLPAQTMYAQRQLTLLGWAALLWQRLEAHDETVDAYYSAAGIPNIWDGVQRLEAQQWNRIAADLWADWAEGAASDRKADRKAARQAAQAAERQAQS